MFKISKWDDACNRSLIYKMHGASNLLRSLIKFTYNRPWPPFLKISIGTPHLLPPIKFSEFMHVIRCAFFRPMVNNKFLIVIETMILIICSSPVNILSILVSVLVYSLYEGFFLSRLISVLFSHGWTMYFNWRNIYLFFFLFDKLKSRLK